MRGFYLGLLGCFAVALSISRVADASATVKLERLIEFGWDEPDPAFMRRHVAEMERAPFDGCVFHLNYTQPDGKKGSFTWESWGRRAFTEAELRPDLEELEATPFRRFTHNFL